MADLQPVPGVIKVWFGMTVGQDTTTGWHQFYSYGTQPGSPTNLGNLAQVTSDSWNSHWASLCVPAIKLTSVVITDLADQAAPIGTWVGTHAGTGVGGNMPASACVLYNYKVARRYRGGKPRSYVCAGVDNLMLNPQQWLGTAVTSFNNAMTGLVADITSYMGTWTSTHQLCNVSYYHGGTWVGPDGGPYKWKPTPRTPPKVDLIVSHSANGIIGSQRRRLRP